MNSLTSRKFRSAWIPPAVAQAPIVTRTLDARRIWWILSASCGVVIDPSTSARSYGPFPTARDASRKFAISISPVTARSSSSQSRRLSWQPSQEASLKTASRGFFLEAISDLPHGDEVAHPRVRENRTIAADEERADLAVPAEPDRAFHVPLERDVNAVF